MNLITSYGVEFKNHHDDVKRTIEIYRSAVRYLLSVVNERWNDIHVLDNSHLKLRYVEGLIHGTNKRVPEYDFDSQFVKFPSYFRRSAITMAIGAVSSYRSNLKRWEDNGREGTAPSLGVNPNTCPAFYNKNMFQWTKYSCTAKIKLFANNDWVWRTVRLTKTDADYLRRRLSVNADASLSAPVVERRPKGHYYLRFTVAETIELSGKPITEQKVCAVDLGVNTDATCSVLDIHGTVLARTFINRGREKDSVSNALHRVSVFQKTHGSHDSGRLWNVASRRNKNLANMAAHDIVAFARANSCDVIVFEYLDTQGKKHCRKKQKLHHWKQRDIQKTAASLAHKYGMHVAHVSAWNTSRLAYDGSGNVKRGRDVSDDTPYDVCVFSTGKIYNCDLSASYNIGARYFIRELIKEVPEVQTEVSGLGSGTRRTLSSLWLVDKYLREHDCAPGCLSGADRLGNRKTCLPSSEDAPYRQQEKVCGVS